MMGRFDLEKVARAGLAAIRDTDESTAYFGSWAVGPGGHPAKKRELAKAFAAMIDAITKEVCSALRQLLQPDQQEFLGRVSGGEEPDMGFA
jgi:hypothetical protein